MRYFDDGTWFDHFVVDGPDPDGPPAPPLSEAFRKVTAKRHTAYALAGLQPCDDCGKPGWSIDGTVVIRHEVDADQDACPGVLARKAALDRAIEQFVGIAAVQPPAPKPLTWAEIAATFHAVSSAPYRMSYPPPAWHRIEVDRTLAGDDLATDGYQDQINRYVAEMMAEHTAKLGELVAEAAKASCTLCVHEDRQLLTDSFELDRDEVRMTMRVRYHMIWPGQVCMAVPRTQYGAPAAQPDGGPPA